MENGRFEVSHLTRGAWIETSAALDQARSYSRRTSHEVRGLKLFRSPLIVTSTRSHLTRGAWIETQRRITRILSLMVAPHTRCVD